MVDYPTVREAEKKRMEGVPSQRSSGGWLLGSFGAQCGANLEGLKRRRPSASLEIKTRTELRPVLAPVFASYDLVGPVADVDAVGFPQGRIAVTETLKDYSVRGILRIASLGRALYVERAPS